MVNLDQFYTKDIIANECYDILKNTIDLTIFDLFVEPSVGKGAFFKLFPENKIGIDLEPKYNHPNIITQNFFDYQPPLNKKICIIGNPPFGIQSSIAVKFFNYAAQFSDIIAFIIPQTFKRVSITNKLDLNFHLILNKDLPIGMCFEPKMNAKCCFQIWQKKNEQRFLINYPKTHDDFSFVKYGNLDDKNQPTPPAEHLFDFIMKAYGSNSGKIFTKNEINLQEIRPKSWHFIKSNINEILLINRLNQLDYSIANCSVRQSSLGHGELINLYTKSFNT